MAKGIGLIGNFRGKVGNMVGYNLKDSNNKQTQGVRVYQPIVKNPKTAAQAEQRAKLLAVNATYRALKAIIDRGQEGKAYGNKSRLAWLKTALKAEQMPWFKKGATVTCPVPCRLTKGSLAGFTYGVENSMLTITCQGVTDSTEVDTIGKVSALLLAGYPQLKTGDQVTFIAGASNTTGISLVVRSIIIDTTSTEATTSFQAEAGVIEFMGYPETEFGSVILSREGDGGEHLRSSESLIYTASVLLQPPFDTTSKTAAIESYKASDAASTDWAEESIQ